jgi:antitoxin ParD1/3/4
VALEKANMSIITFSLSEDLQIFLDRQTAKNGFHTAEDYLCSLLDREREREQLEEMLIEGLESGEPVEVTDSWWEQKRAKLMNS